MANQQELKLVETIVSLYNSISKLPSLSPSTKVNELFTKLVQTCIPPSKVDIFSLPQEIQNMRMHLIKLCSEAEGLLESHYATIIANKDQPLDHLKMFPYYSNYEELTKLEFSLLARHVPSSDISQVAFIGPGPLPFSSLILATRYLTSAIVHNYDFDSSANAKARKLVEADWSIVERMVFHTSDIMEVKRTLTGYDVEILAALVGMEKKQKREITKHLAQQMKPGALLMVCSAHCARTFLYPVVDTEDLNGFEVVLVYHPEDDVVNSAMVAKKKGIFTSCKCSDPLMNHMVHGMEAWLKELLWKASILLDFYNFSGGVLFVSYFLLFMILLVFCFCCNGNYCKT